MSRQAKGKLDEAAASYRRALVLSPNDVTGHDTLASHCESLAIGKRQSPAFAAITVIWNYADAHNQLGRELVAQGKLEEGIDCFRRAIEVKSDDVESHHNLGGALLARGKLDEAIASFRRCWN